MPGKTLSGLLRRLSAKMFGTHGPARSVRVREADSFIVSYPKSGNTWVRYVVASALRKKWNGLQLSDMEEVVPDIYACPERKIERMDSPRVASVP